MFVLSQVWAIAVSGEWYLVAFGIYGAGKLIGVYGPNYVLSASPKADIRKNLANTPKEAEVYGVYLKKLSEQEKEIDTLTAKQKKLMTDEFTARKKYEDYLANISD